MHRRMPAATVLLVDDNAVQAATRQTILKRAGYYVIAALNPERALEQFRTDEFPAEIGACDHGPHHAGHERSGVCAGAAQDAP